MGNISNEIPKLLLIRSLFLCCEYSISFHDHLVSVLPAAKASENYN